MVHLTLAGMSEDRTRLLLVNAAGEEFTLDIDRNLRAALRGERDRFGQLEIEMESVLRPRDIQSRIRSGESPETVAVAAQTSVEKIMPFAAPVLAERAHIAERAQGGSVRARGGAGGSLSSTASRTLGEAVRAQLREFNVSAEHVEWDAFRREDGRWTVSGVFATPERQGTARFTYDLPGNYVVTDGEDARWLVGELPPAQPEAPTPEQAQAAEALSAPEPPPAAPTKRRRLSAVPSEELPLGDDTLDTPIEYDAATESAATTPEASTMDLSEELAPLHSGHPGPADQGGQAGQARRPEEPEADHLRESTPPPTRRPVRKTRGRASVPSWDEIMFGSGESDASDQ